jgi:hypothetical protein
VHKIWTLNGEQPSNLAYFRRCRGDWTHKPESPRSLQRFGALIYVTITVQSFISWVLSIIRRAASDSLKSADRLTVELWETEIRDKEFWCENISENFDSRLTGCGAILICK